MPSLWARSSPAGWPTAGMSAGCMPPRSWSGPWPVLPPASFSPSLMSIASILLGLMAVDFAVHIVLAGNPLLPLLVKALLTAIAITAVISWLQKSTRTDAPADRAVFFRRFAVLSVIVVTINLTW